MRCFASLCIALRRLCENNQNDLTVCSQRFREKNNLVYSTTSPVQKKREGEIKKKRRKGVIKRRRGVTKGRGGG